MGNYLQCVIIFRKLSISKPNIPPITSIRKTPPDLKALLERELYDDSSDEEYVPIEIQNEKKKNETEYFPSNNFDIDTIFPTYLGSALENEKKDAEGNSQILEYDDDLYIFYFNESYSLAIINIPECQNWRKKQYQRTRLAIELGQKLT